MSHDAQFSKGTLERSVFTQHMYKKRINNTAYDYTKSTLTDDTNYNEVDFTSIVGTNAVALVLKINIRDNLTNSVCYLRHPDNTQLYNDVFVRTQVASVSNDSVVIVACKNGKINVKADPKPTDLNQLDITCIGWFD